MNFDGYIFWKNIIFLICLYRGGVHPKATPLLNSMLRPCVREGENGLNRPHFAPKLPKIAGLKPRRAGKKLRDYLRAEVRVCFSFFASKS